MTKGLALFIIMLVLDATACGGVSEPQAQTPTAPSLLITNKLAHDSVYLSWTSFNGRLLSADTVGPGVSRRCARLQPVAIDSAHWSLTATEVVGGQPLTSIFGSNWYHVGDLRAVEAVVSSSGQLRSPDILVWDSLTAVSGVVTGQTLEIPPHC